MRAECFRSKDLQSGLDGVDWLGGKWEDIGLWTFFSRAERRVVFDELVARHLDLAHW